MQQWKVVNAAVEGGECSSGRTCFTLNLTLPSLNTHRKVFLVQRLGQFGQLRNSFDFAECDNLDRRGSVSVVATQYGVTLPVRRLTGFLLLACLMRMCAAEMTLFGLAVVTFIGTERGVMTSPRGS